MPNPNPNLSPSPSPNPNPTLTLSPNPNPTLTLRPKPSPDPDLNPDPDLTPDPDPDQADGAMGAYDRHAPPMPPPPLCLPLRLPRGLHQHEAVAAVEQILARAGWQVSSE